MNTKETILARAAEIIAQRTVRQDKDSFGTLITIDPDGSPVPTTISPSRSEGIRYSNFLTIMYDMKEEVQRAYEIMKEGRRRKRGKGG